MSAIVRRIAHVRRHPAWQPESPVFFRWSDLRQLRRRGLHMGLEALHMGQGGKTGDFFVRRSDFGGHFGPILIKCRCRARCPDGQTNFTRDLSARIGCGFFHFEGAE